MMEIASGKVQPVIKGRKFSVTNLADIWDKHISGVRIDPETLSSFIEKSSYISIEVNDGNPSENIIQKLKMFLSNFLMLLLQIFRDTMNFIIDVITEFLLLLKTLFLFCKRDPIYETPNMFIAFVLLFKRACLQLYRNRSQMLFDTLLHLACGAFVS